MKAQNNKYILDVVPLTRIPLTRNQSFSYLHETKLPVGTLVSVPLFRRKVEGIVIGVRDDFHRLGNIELKSVEKVLEENFLTEKQIELAKFISEYYISPLGIVLKNFVPKRVKARSLKLVNSNLNETNNTKESIKLTAEQKNAVKKITNYELPITKYLLFGPSGSGKTEVYIHSILEMRKKDKDLQFLILLPEKTLTPQALERYGQYFLAEEIVTISSNISEGLLYSNWKKIRSGEAKIIIATRKGAFYPFGKLGLVVVDEEQDISHKNWDMSPRYDARRLAEELGKLHNCPVVFGSATPRVESYWRAINKECKLLKLPYLKESKLKLVNSNLEKNMESNLLITNYQLPVTEIVDMKKERWQNLPRRQAGNYSCISKKLKAEIEFALKYGQQVILFINRQGMSSFSICESCKTVLKCPKCERALVYDKKGEYRCVHCSYKTSITPKCEKCRGIVFKNVGLGTQKVEREIENLFPGAKIARIDSQAAREKGYAEKVYENFSERKTDILIGTQMITKGWDLPSVSLVGIIDADNMLTLPDFRTNEIFFQNLTQVAGRVGRPGSKFRGTVVIQTYQPENRLIKAVCERNYEAFFEAEIGERQALSYPPFAKIVKLVFQDIFLKKVLVETDRVYKVLKNVPNIKISEPAEPFVPNVRGRHRRQIIVKFKKDMPEKLKAELEKLGSGWIIDVDPISTI